MRASAGMARFMRHRMEEAGRSAIREDRRNLMSSQYTEGEGKQAEHTHSAVSHTHDHYHVSHHHKDGMLNEWDHRTSWHTHEHNHAALTHSHDYDQAEEEERHGKEAHVHDHEAPSHSHA